VTGAAPGAPPTASDPAAYYSPGANTKHIIYRSADNHLHELSWVPGTATPRQVDLTVSALARSAVDRPAAYAFEHSDTAHLDTRHVVVYRSTDNENSRDRLYAPMSGLEITRVIRRIRFHFAVSPSDWTNEISVS
jgi:hypothetical protein